MSTPLPHEFEEAPFRVRDAVGRGVRPDRLRRRDLRSDVYGTRTPTHLPDVVEVRAEALATRLTGGQFLSHVTAAQLWGMRLPSRLDHGPLHVTARRPTRTPRLRGVIGHHADPSGPELTTHRGFLLPTPPETWRSLASLLTLEELVIAGDGLLARRNPQATIGQLRRAVARNAGCRGNKALRSAFSRVRPGTDSARETRLRLDVVDGGLPEPEVNGLLTDPGERERFGDLVFRRWRVVAEYEGSHHQESREAYLSDIDRFATLGGRWTFVRVAKEHSRREAVARIQRALLDAGWRP